jgi:hypothetical protein
MQALIQNNKGMSCQLTGIAYGPDGDYYRKRIYALDVAGAVTAVKAIWASVCTGGPMKTMGIGENYRAFRGDKEAKYRSFTSQPLPRVTHYHITVDPSTEAEYFILTSLTSPSKQIGLYDLLRLYTPHPVLPGWGEVLFELGLNRTFGLIVPLEVVGMEWAYRVASVGWDTLIDDAVKSGRITVPEDDNG